MIGFAVPRHLRASRAREAGSGLVDTSIVEQRHRAVLAMTAGESLALGSWSLPGPRYRGGLARMPPFPGSSSHAGEAGPLARIVDLRPSDGRRRGLATRSDGARSSPTVDSTETEHTAAAVANSVATKGSLGVPGSVATVFSAANIRACIGSLACVAYRRCIDCVGCVGLRGAVARRGMRARS